MKNLAREADRKEETAKAIGLYEHLIKDNSAEFLDYLNLICLYFNCLDFGYSAALNIPIEIEGTAGTRALELVSEAEVKFGKNDELTFWRSYIPFLGWGDEVGEWDLRGDSLVPYIYLALEFPTDENIQKALQLYSELGEIEDSQRKELFMGRLEDIIKKHRANAQ